jgi:zinc transport system permease protein
VRALNLLLAVTAAVTVTVAMRAVGLLLVSALMVIPVAAAQQLTRGFAWTLAVAVAIGVSAAVSGTVFSYYVDVPPGSSIVLAAMAVFLGTAVVAAPLAARRARAVQRTEAEAAEAGGGGAGDVPGGGGSGTLEVGVPG